MQRSQKARHSIGVKRLYRSIFGRPGWQSFNRRLQYYGQIGLGIGFTSMNQSGEVAVLPRIVKQLPENPVVLDVGANRGDYSVGVRRARPDARIISFEPNPVPLKALEDNAKAHRLEIVRAACGADSGQGTLFDTHGQGGGAYATLSPEVSGAVIGDDPATNEVDVVTLDGFAADNHLDTIHFLKIDTEGWEIPVLKGASRLIREGRLRWLAYEFCHHHAYTRTFMRDFADLLPGWTFYRILPHGLLPLGDYLPQHWEVFDWQNIFATAPGHDIDLTRI